MAHLERSAAGEPDGLPPETVRHILALSDDALEVLLTVDAAGYRPDVVEFARTERDRRGLVHSSQSVDAAAPQSGGDLSAMSRGQGSTSPLPKQLYGLMVGCFVFAFGGLFAAAFEFARGNRVSLPVTMGSVLALFIGVGLLRRRRVALTAVKLIIGLYAILYGVSLLTILNGRTPLWVEGNTNQFWAALRGFGIAIAMLLYLLNSKQLLAAFPVQSTE